MTIDLSNRVQLCPYCRHTQARGYRCECCGEGTMRIHKQMAQALKIAAAHDEELRQNGVAVQDLSIRQSL
mgnify:CR=1 FL=1